MRGDFRAILFTKSLPYTSKRPGEPFMARPVRECKPSKKCQKHFFDIQRLPLRRQRETVAFFTYIFSRMPTTAPAAMNTMGCSFFRGFQCSSATSTAKSTTAIQLMEPRKVSA